jgi:hypothetical protein
LPIGACPLFGKERPETGQSQNHPLPTFKLTHYSRRRCVDKAWAAFRCRASRAATVLRVFVSYSHAQGDWIWDRLVPSLKAGGAEVLIDRDRFRAGGGVYRQMDATQDQADMHVLVLSAEYLASAPCQHEMRRAIDRDPTFAAYIVLPVRRDDAAVPDALKGLDPNLYADLRDYSRADQWELLLKECDVSLGAAAPDWLAARDETARYLANNRSVNLLVRGDVRWRELIDVLRARPALKLAAVDRENPVAVQRATRTRRCSNAPSPGRSSPAILILTIWCRLRLVVQLQMVADQAKA